MSVICRLPLTPDIVVGRWRVALQPKGHVLSGRPACRADRAQRFDSISFGVVFRQTGLAQILEPAKFKRSDQRPARRIGKPVSRVLLCEIRHNGTSFARAAE